MVPFFLTIKLLFYFVSLVIVLTVLVLKSSCRRYKSITYCCRYYSSFEQLGPGKLKVLTILQVQVLKGTTIQNLEIQWNLYLADTFGTFPSVRLIEGVRLIEVVKIAQCLLTINIQRLLCTVIKLHVVKEAIQSSSSLPFITNFNLFVNAKTLTDFSTYFKDVIQYYYCQFSPVSA